jgi:hypothetical protein
VWPCCTSYLLIVSVHNICIRYILEGLIPLEFCKPKIMDYDPYNHGYELFELFIHGYELFIPDVMACIFGL